MQEVEGKKMQQQMRGQVLGLVLAWVALLI
jgi:hypothetical protein